MCQVHLGHIHFICYHFYSAVNHVQHKCINNSILLFITSDLHTLNEQRSEIIF